MSSVKFEESLMGLRGLFTLMLYLKQSFYRPLVKKWASVHTLDKYPDAPLRTL